MMREDLVVITDAAEAEGLIEYLANKDVISYDTETTGLDRDCEIVGMSFCGEDSIAYYIVLAHWDVEKKVLVRNQAMRAVAAKILDSILGKQLIMHNAIFDCRVTYDTFRIQLIQDVLCDTMIAAHVLDEEGPRGLKDLGKLYFGEDATKEQIEMKASVIARGGIWEDKKRDAIKEMYKADPLVLGKYGAKDTLLTFKVFYEQASELFGQGLDKFFFEEESMPLLRTVTYDLNTTGLRVDVPKLKQYEIEMEHEIGRLKTELDFDLSTYTKERPGFAVTSNQHLAWLLFIRLGRNYRSLTKGGKDFAQTLLGKIPYSDKDKRMFISAVNTAKREAQARLIRVEADIGPKIAELKSEIRKAQNFKNRKTCPAELKAEIEAEIAIQKEAITKIEYPAKMLRSHINKCSPEKYIQADKATLKDLADGVPWLKKLLKMKSEEKILGTYVRGILSKVRYGVVYPSFNQTGTDSGRYSSNNPNFQNLPRDDKRIKSCIIARAGKVFIGADYSQLEPRVFTSISQDPRLLECFRRGEDFYSVVGIGIFGRHECSAYKKDKNAFAEMYPEERQIAKAVCLAAAYGTTASKLAQMLRHSDGRPFTQDECQDIIDRYFEQFPGVRKMMLKAHETAKRDGIVWSLFGRPRRIPAAVKVGQMYKNIPHAQLKYDQRKPLNLAMNSPVQMTAGNIINRAGIRFKLICAERAKSNPHWGEVKIVTQIHDELIPEGPEEIQNETLALLKECMEKTVELPGVALVAEPKIARIMSELK